MRKELGKYVGSMQQLAYVRPMELLEGRSTGMKVFDLKNGKMQLQIMADKCLDISAMTYGGVNINFLSKPGLQGRNHFDTNGQEAVRSIMGGLFFTCGFENICAPCTIDGTDYPMHGRMRTSPAEHLSADASWRGEEYVLSVSGEIREAALFGENMVLRRKIETIYGSKSFTVTDEITNESFREEPLMLLYHINMGYPFLDADSRLYLPTRQVTARDEEARGHEEDYDRMEEPKDQEPEYVFIHTLQPDAKGEAYALVVNPKLPLGLRIGWNMKYLPRFMQWKSIASGDYVLRLEPSNSSVFGRSFHEKEGSVHKLAPLAQEKNVLTFTILDTPEEIEAAIRESGRSHAFQEEK